MATDPDKIRRTPPDTLSGPDREALRRALINLGMPEDQDFSQEGIDRVMRSTLLDSIASVRNQRLEDPSEYGELRINPYARNNNVGGHVTVGEDQGKLNINMVPQLAIKHANPGYRLTERAWNAEPEEHFRKTVLHEGYHSMVPRVPGQGNDRLSIDLEETRARGFAAAFDALSSAEPGETKKQIRERALDNYYNMTNPTGSDRDYSGKGTREDPRVFRGRGNSWVEEQIEGMVDIIARSPVFEDNPYNNPPSIIDRLMGIFSPKEEGAR